MNNSKEQAVSSIAAAQAELQKALSHLEKIPTFDPGNVLLSAHALNNFLSVVAGITELLVLKLPKDVDPVIFNLLRNLEHTNVIMRQTVNRLTHISVGQTASFEMTKVNLTRVIRFSCMHYQKIADDKRIRIDIQVPTAEVFAMGDAVALAAVLDNLLSNAIKYSKFDKEVIVSLFREGGFFVCSVQDEGPGIDARDIGGLFKEGGKLGHTPTAGESSTGYGLAVAKVLVEKMGGSIWCESTVNVGSTFSFRIPGCENESLD